MSMWFAPFKLFQDICQPLVPLNLSEHPPWNPLRRLLLVNVRGRRDGDWGDMGEGS